jgi:23S rRNA pseudouridine2605 synthase
MMTNENTIDSSLVSDPVKNEIVPNALVPYDVIATNSVATEDFNGLNQVENNAFPGNGATPVKLASRFDEVVSGQFDADQDGSNTGPVKRVLAPVAESPKLHKVLAQSGMGSRLEMEQLIMEGRITVNNEPAHIGQRIQFGDHVKVNGKPIRFRIDPPPARVIAYHKPVGEVVTHDDPQNRPTVFRRLPKLNQGKWQSVGRLDLNTEGLLLFTSSGELANNLMHPRFGLEREYAVRVLGSLNKEEKQKLLEGVKLDDGMAQFGSIEDGGGEGSNCWYRVTISEGRNREVRRMIEAVGHAVSRLIRIRYGAMVLPRGLKRGAWMELDQIDIQSLNRAAGSRSSPQRGEPHNPNRSSDGQTDGRTDQGATPNADNAIRPQADRNRGRGGRNTGPRGDRQGSSRGSDGRRGVRQGTEGALGGNGSTQLPSGLRGASRSRPQRGGQGQDQGAEHQSGGAQPDPMKTSFGYIGADSFTRQRQSQGQRRNSGGGGGSRNFGNGGGTGGSGGGGRSRGGR